MQRAELNVLHPVSFQILLILHCSNSSGILIGTVNPHIMSSYITQDEGIIARLDAISEKISAMIAPEILDAQSYFCSRKIATAKAKYIKTIKAQLSSGAISVSLPNMFWKIELNTINLP